jgi:hypothetical protein
MENSNNSTFLSVVKSYNKNKGGIIEGIYLSGEKSPYFKYFYAKEDENKQNLLMMYESIYRRNVMIATLSLFSYNVIKSILWRKGYFAYFFYHTRMISVVVYFTTLYLLRNNFLAHLKNDEILGYYKKHTRLISIEEEIKVKFMKMKLLNEKRNV